ncbi:PorT family protein [Flavobacterium jejuense]|uniref:PorT family protein n=1 Tax=Flavobacterium jejuense TaxID=1544455 RepID=A0ABX0INQ7_9FLAO|nr:porin family protein [Flavobacterium jejuense]NHN25218.1 PorT family protein [Flavobacterium jejuense]
MKSKLFLTIILLFSLQIVTSQIFKVGIKGGLNYANLIDTSIKTDAITSYHAGFVSVIRLSKSLALQPELLYSTQGASYENAISEFKNELGYLSIPFLAKLNLSESVSLEIGPQASFLLSKKDEFDLNDYNTFDFAVDGGLGLQLTEHLFIQARYILGLNEISKNAEAKNSVFQLSAGILF